MSGRAWFLLALALAAAGSGGSGGTSVASVYAPIPPWPMTNRNDLERFLNAAGLPEPWRRFFVFVAAGESGFNITAQNTSTGEAKAAAKAYERNADKLKPCGHLPAQYTWGSGGWFGLLPANAAMNLPASLRCSPPATIVHTPSLSIAAAVGYANGLERWSNYLGTVLSMRAGWGWPAKMGDPEHLAKRRPVYVKRAEKLGYPSTYPDEPLPKLTLSAAAAYNNIETAIAAGTV